MALLFFPANPMFDFLPETQKAALTIAVFIATFFVVLTAGRLLKRRAGIRLGVPFQLFSLAMAFYAAIWIYGLRAEFRNHLVAALILLSRFVATIIFICTSIRASTKTRGLRKST